MIELKHDSLQFSFPEVHPEAVLTIAFQRTLRIPDDDQTYPLPPGLGRFPVRHVDDFAARVPERWLEHGGVLLPMYQSEALWIQFQADYPFAVKIATGKINAVSAAPWKEKLHRDPQDYVVAPGQPWLDGYCVQQGVIRQFVAMPMGAGVTTEEQMTGQGTHGGVQILAYPMTAAAYRKHFPPEPMGSGVFLCEMAAPCSVAEMGLAPGGRMKQEIYRDRYAPGDWDLEHSSRCFVHICNSLVWRQVTAEQPPTTPFTAREYTKAGLPWFDYYDDTQTPIKAAGPLRQLKSVAQLSKDKGPLLPENEPVSPANVVRLRARLQPGQVREWPAGPGDRC